MDGDGGGGAEVGDDEPGFGVVGAEKGEVAVGVEAFALAVAQVVGAAYREGGKFREFQRVTIALQDRFLPGVQAFMGVVDVFAQPYIARCSAPFSNGLYFSQNVVAPSCNIPPQ